MNIKVIAFAKKLPRMIRYKFLLEYSKAVGLYRDKKLAKNSDEIYGKICENLKQKKKIKIAFMFPSSAYWTGDTLFDLFCQDEHFEAYVIVVPFNNGTNKTIYDEYKRTIRFFQDKNIKVIGTIKNRDLAMNKNYQECGSPDMIFYANPYVNAYPIELRPAVLPMNVLTFYIPYGFLIADITDSQFNLPESHHLFWKIFCETEISKKMFAKYSSIGDRNVVFSGYPKMDVFYQPSVCIGQKNCQETHEKIWRGSENAKRIIYSPHHSLKMEDSGLQHSTFLKNYKFMLDMARKYSDTTSWIFRPHPLLEKACYKASLFQSEKEWKEYLEEWRKLPNCVVQISGEYMEAFQTCDAVINDSVSYMAEILYAHKPMLYLKSEHASFNDFGKSLEKVHYICDGDEYDKIEDFIHMILMEKDPMMEKRERYFSKYMDYQRKNDSLASEFIYTYIKLSTCKEVSLW